MAVQINWEKIEDYSLIVYRFDGLWDWDELDKVHQLVFEKIRQQAYIISVVFDMIASVDLPVGALRATRRMLAYAPRNLGIIVVVTDDPVTKNTFTMLSKFDSTLSSRIVTVADFQQAQAMLIEYHLTLE